MRRCGEKTSPMAGRQANNCNPFNRLQGPQFKEGTMIAKISDNKFLVDIKSAQQWMVAQEFEAPGSLTQFWLFPGGFSVVVGFWCGHDGIHTTDGGERWFGFVDGGRPQTVSGYTGGDALGGYVGVSRGEDGYHFGTPPNCKGVRSKQFIAALEAAMAEEQASKDAEEKFQNLLANPKAYPPKDWLWRDTSSNSPAEKGMIIISIERDDVIDNDNDSTCYLARFFTPEGVRYGELLLFRGDDARDSRPSAGYQLFRPGTWESDPSEGTSGTYFYGEEMYNFLLNGRHPFVGPMPETRW